MALYIQWSEKKRSVKNFYPKVRRGIREVKEKKNDPSAGGDRKNGGTKLF